MKLCKKYIFYPLGFVIGAVILCGFATIQKLISGVSLRMIGYLIPFFYGGTTGTIIGVLLCRMREEVTKQKQTFQQYIETEKNFRNLFNSLNESVFVHPLHMDKLEKFIEVNDAACKRFGYTREEFMSMTAKDISSQEDVKTEKISYRHNMAQNSGTSMFEATFFTKDNESFIGEVNADKITINGEDFVISVVRDITEKKNDQERYNNLLKNLPDLVYKMSISDGRYLYMNDACEKVLGFPKEKFYANPLLIRDVIHPDFLSYFTNEWNKILSGNPSDVYIYKVIDSQGKEKWIRQNNNFEYNEKGKIISIEGIVSDITEEKNAEIALKDNEEKLSRLLENMKLIAVNLDRKGDIKFCNQFLLDLTGWKRDEVIDKNWFDLFIPENIRVKMEKGVFVNTLKSGKVPTYYENPIKKKNGTIAEILWNNTLFFDENANMEFITSIGQDITERNKILQEIKDSESKFKSYMDNAPIGIFVTDENGKYIDGNQEACEQVGLDYNGLLSQHVLDLIAPESMEKGKLHFNSLVRNGYAYDEIFLKKVNGEKFLAGINAVKINDTRFIAFIDDLTDVKKGEEEREQLEHQLHRSQRLETIGTLVGGISHDFNNLLTPILGYSDMIVRNMEKSDPNYDSISEIFQAANHAKDLINQLLNFSRNTKNDKKPVFIHSLLKEAIKMLRPMIPSSIIIQTDIDEDYIQVLADSTKLHQLIVNIINNSNQAMEENGGILSISLKKVLITNKDLIYHTSLGVGEYFKIVIADTGIGMDESVIERIFDPFFTTKEVGKGSGLGLSVAHGVIQDHNGEIQVKSTPNEGTEFSIFLPMLESNYAESAKPEILVQGKLENILVVDDEVAVARTVVNILKILGFHGIPVHNPHEAIEVFQKNHTSIKLVITDLTMPEMNGLKLIEKLKEINANCPVIMMTGYGNKVTLEEQKRLKISSLISKPVMVSDLAKCIKKIY